MSVFGTYAFSEVSFSSITASVVVELEGVSTSGVVNAVTASGGQGRLVAFSGWNVNTWGSGSWGNTTNLPAAASAEVGSVALQFGSSVTVSGVEATGSVGESESAVNISVSVDGLTATGQLTEIVTTQSAVVDLAFNSVSGNARPGILDGFGNAIVYLDGLGPEASVGGAFSALGSAEVSVGGLEASGEVKEASVTGSAVVSPDGVEASGEVKEASVKINTSANLDGLTSFGLVKEVSALASAEVDVSGFEITPEVENVVIKINAYVNLEGVSASSFINEVVPKGSSSISLVGLEGRAQINGVLVWGKITPDAPTNWSELDPEPETAYSEINPDPKTNWAA